MRTGKYFCESATFELAAEALGQGKAGYRLMHDRVSREFFKNPGAVESIRRYSSTGITIARKGPTGTTGDRTTLEERGTWEFVPRISIGRHRPLRCKYVYRKKLLKDGSIQYKSRFVGCGYSQVADVNYSSDAISAGVISYSSVRFLMSLACQKGYILSQADITGVYLDIYFRDEVYMEPPPDMRGPDGGPLRNAQGRELVCRLKRSLFRLKQSGHAWSECLHEFLLKDPKYAMGFTQFTGKPNIFRKSFRAQWQAGGTSFWGIRRESSHLFLIRKSSVLVYEPARGFVLSMQIPGKV